MEKKKKKEEEEESMSLTFKSLANRISAEALTILLLLGDSVGQECLPAS